MNQTMGGGPNPGKLYRWQSGEALRGGVNSGGNSSRKQEAATSRFGVCASGTAYGRTNAIGGGIVWQRTLPLRLWCRKCKTGGELLTSAPMIIRLLLQFLAVTFVANNLSYAADWKRETVQGFQKLTVKPPGQRVEVEAALFVTRSSLFIVDSTVAGDINYRSAAEVIFENCFVVTSQSRRPLATCEDYSSERRRILGVPNAELRTGVYLVLRGQFRGKVVTRHSGYVDGGIRVGFGHLGNFPAQIVVSEILVDSK